MWDEPLNTTIDEVARQMTDGTPGDVAAFRRRVIARIESGHSPRPAWRASFVLTAIAAAAAIIITLFVARERRPGSFGPGEMAGPAAQTRSPLPAGRVAGPNLVRQSDGGLAAAPDPLRRPRAAGPSVVTTTPALEPDTVVSIAVTPLVVDTLSPEPIQLEQLETITLIPVAPLDIPDVPRRNQ